MKNITLLVTGGSRHRDPEFINEVLDYIHKVIRVLRLTHGHCPTGVDKFADQWCKRNRKVERVRCPAAWDDLDVPGAVIRTRSNGDRYNFLAGFMRNAEMYDKAKPDVVLGFKGAGGTKNMMDYARRRKKAGDPVVIIDLGDSGVKDWKGAIKALRD